MKLAAPREQLDLASALSFRLSRRNQIGRRPIVARKAAVAQLKVGFVVSPNFTLLPFSGFIEALRQIWDDGRRTAEELCSWEILAPDRKLITSSCGVSIKPTKLFGDPREFDYIAVVGGQLPTTTRTNPSVVAFLQRAAKLKVPMIGICTGSVELARAGLLDGYTACVHWYHHREFVDEFPGVNALANSIFIVDRDRITCAGGTIAIDLAADLISQHFGELRAARALSLMGVQRRRPGDHFQVRFFDGVDLIKDQHIARAIQLIEARMSSPPTVGRIARELGTSVRHLERKFHDLLGVGPAQLSRSLRLRYGHWLLCNTKQSITDIAYSCGFADGSHFTRHFRKMFECTPRKIRDN